MPDIDIRPAVAQMAGVLANVPDDAIGGPTPCEGMTLGQLIGHVVGFAEVFTLSARKELGPMTATPPKPDDADLEPGWQQRAADHLAALGEAWQADDAWDGMTQAGGVDLPGAMAGRIVLDELVVHGWDVARASGSRSSPTTTTWPKSKRRWAVPRRHHRRGAGTLRPDRRGAGQRHGLRAPARPHRPRPELVTVM